MTMDHAIHIALISDEAYAERLAVTMASILLSAAPEDEFVFYIVDDHISELSKKHIAALERIQPFACHYLPVRDEDHATLPYHRCAPCAYYRVKLPELLPTLEKIIYLDCDVIVLKSLRPLWETPLGNAGIAAARDTIDYMRADPMQRRYFRKLGLKEESYYINSGVMVMNLDKMRHMHFERRFFILREELDAVIRFSDQDLLNVIFQQDLVLLPQEWNIQAPMEILFPLPPELESLNPAIIHYTTKSKPWQQNSTCPYRDIYLLVEAMYRECMNAFPHKDRHAHPTLP